MIRSASPSFCVRSTMPSSRNKLMGPLSPTGGGLRPANAYDGVRAASASSRAVSSAGMPSALPTVVRTWRSAAQ